MFNQGTNIEKSSEQKLNPGTTDGCVEYHPFLTLLLFVSRQKVNRKNRLSSRLIIQL